MDRLASMAAFVETVRAGSLARAAETLGISAPMVGRYIGHLESRMGVRLFVRTTRRQSLTEFGAVYFEECKAILADIEAAEALAGEHLSAPRGRLRVSMPALLGRHCIAPLLIGMVRKYPELRLELNLTDHFADPSDYDLLVRSMPTTTDLASHGTELTMRRLSTHAMQVVASPDYLARTGTPATLDALEAHGCIAFARLGRAAPWQFMVDGGTVDVAPRASLAMDDLAAIADAAASGAGLAWLPSWLNRPYVERGALTVVPLEAPSLAYNNYALWPRGAEPMKVRLAIETLAMGLPSLM